MVTHKILNRQLKKYATDAFSDNPDFVKFIDAVNDSYEAFDRDKELSDHAFMITENEFNEINNLLKQEVELKKISILKLKNTLNTIKAADDTALISDNEDLLEIVDLLNNEIAKRKKAEQLLVLAKNEAEKASRAKSDFLSIISHEIRTPLNAILGMGHLLLKNVPRPDQVDNLKILKTSADNLLILINDILDFNKIEAGKLHFEEASFSIANVVTDIVAANKNGASERENEIVLRLDPEIPEYFMGDALRIGQVLNNLVSNAVKFTSCGKIIVSANLQSIDNGVALLSFSIRDTGVGIAMENQVNIFSPFTQASTSITREYGGTGLGLAITKRILRLMNSDIYLKSEFGNGSEFHFSLQLPINLPEMSNNDGGYLEEQDLHNKRILLVEDTLFNVFYATQLLEGWNAQVQVAENGVLAIESLKNSNFDLILMDLQMPVMDGYTATTKIREFNTSIPIIALTAAATIDVREKVLNTGMQDYITKPFNPQDFFLKLKRHLA